MIHDPQRESDLAEGPWNPGIGELTGDLLGSCTVFRAENILNDLQQAKELSGVTGIPIEELAIFRPERLALHELLVRVTADLEVPDPQSASVRSLGVNFRRVVNVISRGISPNRAVILKEYARVEHELSRLIENELLSTFGVQTPTAVVPQITFWQRLEMA
jgi:hypothetical protein